MIDVGGLVPLSTTDYPGRLSAVVFLQGCPWRCGYCHNPGLRDNAASTGWTWDAVCEFLERRAGLLDAVVFSGGEPTLQRGLARAIEDVRAMGFRAGLHTAGIYPGRLAPLLPRLNWIGLDVKAPFEDYPKVVGRRAAGASARDSLERVLDSPVEHEVRTTYHPALHDAAGLLELARMLSRMGVRRYVLQEFRATGCEDAALADFAPLLDEAFMAEVAPLFASFEWRRAASAAQ